MANIFNNIRNSPNFTPKRSKYSSQHSFFLLPTDENEVSDYISSLEQYKAPGIGRIIVYDLKKLQNIVKSITRLKKEDFPRISAPIYHYNDSCWYTVI